MFDMTKVIYTLRHMETGEYVCLRQDGAEYLAAFSNGDAAHTFRTELRLVEFVDIAPLRLATVPFDHYYLDGQLTTRAALAVA